MGTTATDLWTRRFHPAPDAPHRLVCLPHAGGSASYYFPVSRALSRRSVDVVAVQYPGRQDRRHEPCVESVTELADRLVDVVRPLADRPLTLFGHSYGASTAFELAVRLEAAGTPVHGLFVSGRRAPSAHRVERAHELADDALLAEIRKLDGTDSGVLQDEEILRMVLPAIRADYKAAETYRWESGPKVRAPVRALIGDSDPKVTEAEARRWADHTTADFDLELFPGGHFYLNEHSGAVIDRIARYCGG
ncbi:thioesterase II family protein [Saccharothrix sp. Mg75]|uniref:thioesterase II family protein n=1 Tax=Saccharothrix sp. Mg75 TaxID=3445357 RepID=UPI003EEE3CD4